MKNIELLLGSEVSPNVKAIVPNLYSGSEFYPLPQPRCIRHVNGVYEIQLAGYHTQKSEFEKVMCNAFSEYFKKFTDMNLIEDVSITGVKENINDGKGSSRFSTMSPELAEMLTTLINRTQIPHETKISKSNFFRVADYFRFMRYENGGQHYPHYDSDYQFIADEDFITRYSMVLYHNHCDSGELFFCNDSRETITSDWDRQANDDEIYLTIKPAPMKLVIFPHTLCHGVKKFDGEQRDIIRGDLIFSDRVLNYGY